MQIIPLDTLSEKKEVNYWGNDRRGLIFDLEDKTFGAVFNGSSILSDTLVKAKGK